MAFTVYQQPPKFSPAYNDNIFVVGSDNISEPNYKYVFKLYIGGPTPIIIKRFPHPTLDSCYINVGRTIERYVKHDIDKSVFGFQRCDNSIANYKVDFYEEFDVDGVPTISELLVLGDKKYIWNGEINFLKYQNYNQNDYLLNFNKILNHTLERKVLPTDSGWIYFLYDSDKEIRVEILTYDSSNIPIANYTAFSTIDIDYKYLRVDCCPINLNQMGLDIGTQPIIDNTVARYEFRILNEKDDELCLLNFKIIDTCTEVYRLHYLNNLGAFESFNFIRQSKHTETIKREKYKAVVGGLTSETSYGYNKSDRSTNTNYTQITESFKVRSEWLSEEYQNILEQLISSPIVYLDTDVLDGGNPLYNNGLVSIDIKSTAFEFDTKRVKKMLSLEVDFDLSFNRYRQRY